MSNETYNSYLDAEGLALVLSGIRDKINAAAKGITNTKGKANGIASLDAGGNVPLSQLGNLDTTFFEIVTELPTDIRNIKKHIYILKDSKEGENNKYAEYIYTGDLTDSGDLAGDVDASNWEKLGDFVPTFDLQEYVKKAGAVAKLEFYDPFLDNVFDGDDDKPSKTAIRIEFADGSHKYIVVPEAQAPINTSSSNSELSDSEKSKPFQYPGSAGFMSASDKAKLDKIDLNALTASINAANTAADNTNKAIKAAETATAGAEKVDATLTEENVFEVTERTGAKKTLDMSGLVSAKTDVARIQESMGAYSDRPDITLVAKETNKAISADGVKVAKTGWAIAEFIAEKGNIYLFKPNEVDGDVCIFAEEITNIETRGIDYTYTYNTDGTIATAKATYLGATHIYTFAYAEGKSYTITDEAGETVEALPMTYETKVGSYSPLVRLNADAELPIDGYCRYMSHFKGNSSIKIVVSYKIDAADLVMKVVRDGVFASISTQLGNLSQKEDETRKKIEELHGSYADLLFASDWDYLFVDNKKISVTPGKKMRVYPKFNLKIGYTRIQECPLVWCDVSNLDTSKFTDMNYMFYGCTSISNIDVSRWNVRNVTSMVGVFCNCTSLTSLNIEGWDVSNVNNMSNLFKGCISLTSLNVNNWNISNVKRISGMFSGGLSLKSINLSNWDTSSIIDMSFLFYQSDILNIDMSGNKWAFNADVIDKLQDSANPFNRWADGIVNYLILGKNFFAYDGKFKDNLGDFRSNSFKNWDKDSFIKSFVENSYDRKSNGLSVMTFNFDPTLKNHLTEQNIAAITAKGYIIA